MASLEQLINTYTPLPLKSQWFVHFCNVYRDRDDEVHYSTEDFVVDQDGIFSFDDALQEAFLKCVLSSEPWEYVSTMTDGDPVTSKMLGRLAALSRAAQVVREFGEEPERYSIHDIEQRARDLRHGDSVPGRA